VVPTNDSGFYVADAQAHVVRQVDSSGVIATVAGNGMAGYAGDGGPGRLAELNQPTRLRLGPDGALYIADTGNNVIRRLDLNGIITTFAGTGEAGYAGDDGPADEALLQSPYDMRFSPEGDLYVADAGNHVVRRIDAQGTITTVVGTGQAGLEGDEGPAADCLLNEPTGINLDDDGSLWIADSHNHVVRRVSRFLDSVN
jgi:streptogramin lyase